MKGKKLNQNSLNDLSEKDIQDIEESLVEGQGFSVKGKEVCLLKEKAIIEHFPEKKEEVACHLAIVLEDEDNLAWYEKLARERRRDFLKNCLRLTMAMFQRGTIQKTKAAYFTGVVKGRTEQQKRLEEYKKKHTSLYGYDDKSYEK